MGITVANNLPFSNVLNFAMQSYSQYNLLKATEQFFLELCLIDCLCVITTKLFIINYISPTITILLVINL